MLAAFVERDEVDVFGAGVVGAGADDFAVGALLHYVGGPAAGAGYGEDGREHRGGDSHGVVGGGGEPVEVGEHALDFVHDGFEAVGDVVDAKVAGGFGEAVGDFLDDGVAGVADGVDRVAEADDDFLVLDALADVGLCLVGRGVALLDFEGDFVGAAVLGAFEGADGSGNAGVEVGAGAGDDAGGEGGGVELVLGVEDQRDVHGLDPLGGGGFAVEEMEEVSADAVVV